MMKLKEIGEKMANQVVNTFLADRCFDTSDCQKNNIRSALTIASDYLIPKGVLNPDHNTIGAQEESSSFYGEIVPIEISEINLK